MVGRGTVRVTQLKFYAYWMQIRLRKFGRVLHTGFIYLPNNIPPEDPELHELVVRHMIHNPHGRSKVCMTRDGADSSKIGKAFQNDTLNHGYSKYQRREEHVSPDSNITNAHIAPSSFGSIRPHINVKFCASICCIRAQMGLLWV
jgi:hypothetical protein